MTKKARYVLIGTSVVLAVAALPFLGILPFVASNAAAAGWIAIFTKRPTESELTGRYAYNAEWGTARLELRSDHTFSEQIDAKEHQTEWLSGIWSSEFGEEGFSADVSLKPFIAVDDISRGRRFDVAGLNFYKQRFGSVYGEIDPDTGERFLKQ